RLARVVGQPHVVVAQHELAEAGVEVRRCRADQLVADSRRLRIGVGVEDRLLDARAVEPGAAGPEAEGALLGGVAEPGDRVGVWRRVGGPAGVARRGEVERAPVELDRAGLAGEAGPELVEDPLDLAQDVPVPLGLGWVIGRVPGVLVKRDGIWYL